LDSGYLAALTGKDDFGMQFEHAVLRHIRSDIRNKPFFYKDTVECDFIVQNGRGVNAIQVAFECHDPTTRQREIRGLIAACRSFKLSKGWMVTFLDNSETVIQDGITINIVPFKEWIQI